MPNSDIPVYDPKSYTDDQLIEIVYCRLTPWQDTQLRELIALGKQGKLTTYEKVS